MVIMAAQFKSATAAQVREWANAQDDLTVGKRGRFAPEVIAAFNKAHKRNRLQYAEGQWEETVAHTAKPAKGRKVTEQVNLPRARQWAKDNGHEVGSKGPLPVAVLDAYVLRG